MQAEKADRIARSASCAGVHGDNVSPEIFGRCGGYQNKRVSTGSFGRIIQPDSLFGQFRPAVLARIVAVAGRIKQRRAGIADYFAIKIHKIKIVRRGNQRRGGQGAARSVDIGADFGNKILERRRRILSRTAATGLERANPDKVAKFDAGFRTAGLVEDYAGQDA